MKLSKSTLAIAMFLTSGTVMAAGPLYTTDGANPQPYKWDTSAGSIPVYVDGGAAFTFDYDGSVFLSIERANEITQFAFDQWNNVETSTFEANIAGSIEEQVGIADVTGANAAQIYTVENGYGFYVLYDTDGSILEDFFGVPKSAVLGIAFPEWADENGNITEATAVLNGWNVYVQDTKGEQVAGVFTHEFGHAINLSHSQTNGQLAYLSWPGAPLYPGVAGCDVEAIHDFEYPAEYGGNPADPDIIETMFPFIRHDGVGGVSQSTVNVLDDRVSISNLYPTAEYKSQFGSIEGTLRLKDGQTEYSGINIIARNVNDPLFDAVSAQSGNLTQGKVGPDGSFKINGLTPGQSYVLYTEEIYQGGYPTQQTPLVSVAEYWNEAEGSNPAADDACDVTPIIAEAGKTKQADLTFNGYDDGIEFRPIVNAHLTDLAKNGRSSMGVINGIGFTWDENKDFTILPDYIRVNSGRMNRNGNKLLVNSDLDGNGISAPAIWTKAHGAMSLGDLTGNTCGGSGMEGMQAASGWDIDDAGNTVVGLAYKDANNNGYCTEYDEGELVPFIWTPKAGMHELDTRGVNWDRYSWIRAHAISGNGDVVLGSADGWEAVAWVNEGEMINLYEEVGATESHAASYDGKTVALATEQGNTLLWDHTKKGDAAFTDIGGLTWCEDIPFLWWGQDLCVLESPEWVQSTFGAVPASPFDMNDDGSVIIARAGDFWAGFVGAIYIDTIGWMPLTEFFGKQGVMEAENAYMNNPLSISGSGSEMVGGIAGVNMSYHVNMDQVYVCEDGQSVKTGFPKGLISKVKSGAEFGRCEHLN
ncbi:conserved hypothetical protein [Shewanella halifaxensis HAW-EB4]|uniref:Peptidase M10 metallopeptidase domain-containing protein n=1 Tax=Shewanella halifaxensis (strain HAW-EB4) TaxID=458817 RepID=B0TSY6_SHEHH|nr:hypothetical protein [Shewanella halifaxensis]ABZ76547.1 conserved hypothetical protein [Shewanella halifaxensis HAW-EB4]